MLPAPATLRLPPWSADLMEREEKGIRGTWAVCLAAEHSAVLRLACLVQGVATGPCILSGTCFSLHRNR